MKTAVIGRGTMTVKLSRSEVNHILTLINQNEQEGWYFGPKDQYWKRSEKIKTLLSGEVKIIPKKHRESLKICAGCGSFAHGNPGHDI